MDKTKLYEILRETTVQLRKGAAIEKEQLGAVEVTHIYMMPSAEEMPSGMEAVDMHFLIIGVDKAKAEARKADLIGILNDWPDPAELAGGPSYIAVGATVGDQGAAFQLFALGKVLGLWSIITPESFGMTGDEAARAAGSGYIMTTGYRPTAVAA